MIKSCKVLPGDCSNSFHTCIILQGGGGGAGIVVDDSQMRNTRANKLEHMYRTMASGRQVNLLLASSELLCDPLKLSINLFCSTAPRPTYLPRSCSCTELLLTFEHACSFASSALSILCCTRCSIPLSAPDTAMQ